MEKSNKPVKVLVIGGSGQIGLTLKGLSKNHKGFEYYFPNSDIVDLRKRKLIKEFLIKKNIQIVINFGAYTNVDGAEKQRTICEEINYKGPRNIAIESSKQGISVIHFSTDYVFGKGPMRIRSEKDNCLPVNFYGLSKYKGEKAILKYSDESLIVRLASVYSPYKNNFVKTMTKKILTEKKIKIVSDQKISMTRSYDVAKNIPNLIKLLKEKNKSDSRVLHFTNKGYTNCFLVSKIIKKEAQMFLNKKLEVELVPIKSSSWKSNAKRPLDSRLKVNFKLLEKNNINLPKWKESLRHEVINILPDVIKEIKYEN